MTEFTVHTADSAPAAAKPILEASQKSLGFTPNLYGVFAEAPPVLQAYQALSDFFGATSFTNDERHVIWLAINVEHECHYCVPAHTVIARSQNLDEETITALRDAAPLKDPKLEALRTFTLKVVRQRGVVDDAAVEAFLAAGYTKAHILEVILGVSHKVLSNYANHFADTAVDAAFTKDAWEPTGAKAA
ncbi:MAG: carboxymuconolactone decarboxylase family protein [Pseudomonadota bacterium]